MGTSRDSRDDRHAYVGYILQNLSSFVVNLAPNAGIGGIAERRPLDISNELPTSAREDYDLVRSILRNLVEGIDKFRVSLRGHNEWPAVAVELNDKYAFGVARQLQITIGGEVVILMCLHSIFVSFFVSFGFGFVHGLAGKDVEQLRPDVAAEALRLDGREHGGHVEFLRHARQERDVVDHRGTVAAGHAEGHLGLLVNEHDGGIRRRVEFVVLVHVIFSRCVDLYCWLVRSELRSAAISMSASIPPTCRTPLMKKVGVPLTPPRAPLRKSSRTRAECVPLKTSASKRPASRPSDSAYCANASSCRASWFSNSRSCISQNFPCAPAASAASAACSAKGCMLLSGKLRKPKHNRLPSCS